MITKVSSQYAYAPSHFKLNAHISYVYFPHWRTIQIFAGCTISVYS